jgi:GMP synthase-like glutamine amidotransferase
LSIWPSTKLTPAPTDTYHDQPKVKIFGSCFGHQIINQSLFSHTGGLHVMPNPQGWELGVQEIAITPKFAACFPQQFQPSLTISASPTRIQLQLSHQDAVIVTQKTQLPPECIEMGSSALCSMQGMYVPDRVLTFQAHPEFDRAVNGACINWIGESTWPAEVTREYLRMADQDDDAGLIGEVVMEFLLRGSK